VDVDVGELDATHHDTVQLDAAEPGSGQVAGEELRAAEVDALEARTLKILLEEVSHSLTVAAGADICRHRWRTRKLGSVDTRSTDSVPTMDQLTVAAASGAARWRASLLDLLAIVGWIALLSAAAAVLRLWVPGGVYPTAPLAVDAAAFAATVLPTWIYLTVCESGPGQATWGKRRAGLRVVSQRGRETAGSARIAGRNAVKVLPWQLAHIAVARLILGVGAPVVIAVPYILSLTIPCVSIVMAWRDDQHRALHDRVAGTRVVRAVGR